AQVRAYQAGVPAQIGVALSGGLLWIGQRGLDERSVFFAGIIVAVACAALLLQTRRAYGQSLVESLRAGLADVFTGAHDDLRSLRADAQARAAAVAGLQDPRPAVRRVAAEILGKMQSDGSAGALAAAARDADAGVRAAAIQALSTLTEAAVAPALRGGLSDPEANVRVASLRGLASMPQAPVEWFHAVLGDSHPVVRAEAAAAVLQRRSDARAAAEMKQLLHSPEVDRQVAAIRASARAPNVDLQDDLKRAVESSARPIRVAALEALAARRDPAAPALLMQAMDDDDPVVRRTAARAHQASALDARPLVEALRTGSQRLQEAALSALRGKALPFRQPLLEWAAAQVPRAQDRRQIADDLESHVARQPSPALDYLRTLVKQEEMHIEYGILTTMSLLGAEEAMAFVARGLRSRDPGVRSQAIEALDTLGEKAVSRALVPLLEDSDRGNGSTDLAGLLDRLADHPRSWIRALTLWAMSDAVGDRGAWQRRLDQETDPQVRALVQNRAAAGGNIVETSPTLSTIERVLFLRQVPLFAHLEPEDLQRIAEISVERVYEPGDALVEEGEVGDELLVIVDGEVRVLKGSKGGERLLRRLGRGDHLGELAILREQPRSATAVSEGKSVRVLALRGEALTAILEDRPAVSLAMLASLAERLASLA
ncbi:MAG TPA: HEAT repeat domain-containing protein, partial [Anaerolineales bacterium]|nr:HEAT repeat domain-containing protein [Anaerolineales bacterium]